MKKIRIEDIAKQAGVSNTTVSRAINQKELVNEQTYLKILNAMHALGYRPDENISRPISATLKRVLIIDVPTFDNPFYGDIIYGIETIANRNNYQIFINSSGFSNLVSFCRDTKIGGIITLSGYSATQLDQLSSLTTVVQCCEFCQGYPLPYVSIDDYEATKKALSYLYQLGKRNFSIINQSVNYKFSLERNRAFLDFLSEKHLKINEDFFIRLPEIDYQLAVSAVKNMFSKKEHPDAIFAVSDVYAAGAIKALINLNIDIPKDVSVIGFDNLPLAEMVNPSITSIQQPRFMMGSMACEFLLEKIREPEIPNKQYLLDTELILRESTLRK